MGVKILRWLFPREWRERYFAEMVEVNRSTPQRLRDLIDILHAAVRLRSEQVGRHPMRVGGVSAVLTLVGVAGLVWCLPMLAHGWAEVPGHWWSAPWLAAALAGGAGLTCVAAARLRSRAR